MLNNGLLKARIFFMKNILLKIRKVVNWLVIIFFVYMVLSVFYQVLGRYVFHYKLGIAAETATYAQIWMVLLAAGIGERFDKKVAKQFIKIGNFNPIEFWRLIIICIIIIKCPISVFARR